MLLMLLGLLVIIHWLLASETEFQLLLEHLSLISRHELLGVLVWICELAATLVIKILLRAAIAVRRGLSEGRVCIRPLTEIFLLQTFSGGAHAGVHQSRALMRVLLVHHRSLLADSPCRLLLRINAFQLVIHNEL